MKLKINYKLIIGAFFVVGLIFIFMYLFFINKNNSNPSKDTAGKSINLNPPTQEEKNASNEAKEKIVNKEDSQKSKEDVGQNEKKKASVIISDAGQYDKNIEVRAFSPNAYEDGNCYITIRNDIELSKIVKAIKDATVSRCDNLSIPSSEFSKKGEWTVIVKFESVNYSGESEPKRVIIN